MRCNHTFAKKICANRRTEILAHQSSFMSKLTETNYGNYIMIIVGSNPGYRER